MIDLASFTVGLGTIALQLNQAVPEDKFQAFHLALERETDPDEWALFVAGDAVSPGAVKRFGWKWMPTVPELLDALQVYRGREPLTVEATRAYERVLGARRYTPEGGGAWVYRDVIEQCGVAAGVAFLAAGGHEAFQTTRQEERRREAFVEAYMAEARAAPAGRLTIPGLLAQIAGGAISADDAKRLVSEIEKRAAELPAAPPSGQEGP